MGRCGNVVLLIHVPFNICIYSYSDMYIHTLNSFWFKMRLKPFLVQDRCINVSCVLFAESADCTNEMNSEDLRGMMWIWDQLWLEGLAMQPPPNLLPASSQPPLPPARLDPCPLLPVRPDSRQPLRLGSLLGRRTREAYTI